jgi:bacterioferritin-associated ferredoxin
MYKCICHAVTDGDVDRYHLIGTKCGKCLECPMGKKMQKKFKKKNKKLMKKTITWPEPDLEPINLYNAPKIHS